MNTRATRRTTAAPPSQSRAEDEATIDNLVRQAIRGPKRTKGDGDFKGADEGNKTETIGKDKITSLNDDTKSKPRPSGNKLKQKVAISKSTKPTSVSKSYIDDYSSQSGSESDNEEDNSEEEIKRTSATTINVSLSKAADEKRFSQKGRQIEDKWNFSNSSTDDYIPLGEDVSKAPNLRSRKDVNNYPPKPVPSRSYTYGEREEPVYKQQFKKAQEKKALLDTRKIKSFSDDEELFSREVKDKASSKPEKGTSLSGNGNLWIWIITLLLLLVVVVVVIFMFGFPKTSSHNAEQQLRVMNAFHDRFRKLPLLFPGQSQDLWQRSRRILELQLRRGAQNEEPAIILLTAAQDAEQMLYCVGKQLAEIYASTLNGSYTVLSGLEITSQDSEDVKMFIDQRLNERFQANHKAAVLHRLELLPPGSLLILYKYCDHENAAFKNVALVLTVLLKNSTMQADIQLDELEEAVYDLFKETFIDQVQSKTSHNKMDNDKLGGVWSRISHVVLPVFPEQNVRECHDLKASP